MFRECLQEQGSVFRRGKQDEGREKAMGEHGLSGDQFQPEPTGALKHVVGDPTFSQWGCLFYRVPTQPMAAGGTGWRTWGRECKFLGLP